MSAQNMSIDKKRKDLITSMATGLAGMAPVVGPLIAQVVDTLIPNQRIDRIADFVEILNDKVTGIEQELLKIKFTTQESIDLLEDALYQAARALSLERKEYIASLMKNSLTDDQRSHVYYKTLLSLLGELNDVEVLLLKSRSFTDRREQDTFYEKHKDVVTGPIATFGSPREEINREAVHKSFLGHLVRLGLIEDEIYGGITTLGELLLRSIDQGHHL